MKLSDSGRYDCEAASRIGGHQKSMYLDIECKFYFFFLSFPSNIAKKKSITNDKIIIMWSTILYLTDSGKTKTKNSFLN